MKRKLVNQNDYEDVIYLTNLKDDSLFHETTVKESGCGVCCATMILNHLYPEKNYELKDAILDAYEAGANYSAGTNFYRFSKLLCNKYKLECKNTEDIEETIDHVLKGDVALVNVGGDHDDHIGVLSHNGHYVLIDGYINNKLRILDPGLEPNKYLEKERKDKVIVVEDYIYVDTETLVQDFQNRLPHPIFLFKKAV